MLGTATPAPAFDMGPAYRMVNACQAPTLGINMAMRHFIDMVTKPLTEGFESSSYGYWITPEGKIIPLITWSHGKIAAEEMGLDFSEYDEHSERDVVDQGLEEGAIRVVANRSVNFIGAEWSSFSVTSSAKRALLDVMALYPDKDFILQDEHFNDLRSAVRFVRMS